MWPDQPKLSIRTEGQKVVELERLFPAPCGMPQDRSVQLQRFSCLSAPSCELSSFFAEANEARDMDMMTKSVVSSDLTKTPQTSEVSR